MEENVLSLWHLELCQLRRTMLRNLCRSHLPLNPDSSANNLTESLIGQAKHRALTHSGVLIEGSFNFRTINVLAASDDDVFQAVQDVDKSALHFRNITRVEPTLFVDGFGGVLRTVMVANHVHGAFDA